MSFEAKVVRRSGTSASKMATPASTSDEGNVQTLRKYNHLPFLPTALEAYLLAIYPGTLLLGAVFSLLEPNARNAPYSAASHSYHPEAAPSYFAKKNNLFNVAFVKLGWFWTTMAFCIFMLLHPSTGPSKRLDPTARRIQGFLRYGLVTLWWIGVTQWFFGPPLIDRGFRLTGGRCELLDTEEGRASTGSAEEFSSAVACKLAGGEWKGGHDISGHVFLLVLASGFLWLEVLPVILKAAGLREKRLLRHADGSVTKATSDMPGADQVGEDTAEARVGVSAPLIVVALSWWMLLMTAAYFHTWPEKVWQNALSLYIHSPGAGGADNADHGLDCRIHGHRLGLLLASGFTFRKSCHRHARRIKYPPPQSHWTHLEQAQNIFYDQDPPQSVAENDGGGYSSQPLAKPDLINALLQSCHRRRLPAWPRALQCGIGKLWTTLISALFGSVPHYT
jgi:hypothetical protein